MKKILMIFGLLLLVGCNNKASIEYLVEEESNNIYCVCYSTKEIESVNTRYIIKDYNDVFLLHIKYLNYLPQGYFTYGRQEVGLINSYLKDNDVYYLVDDYICLVNDKKQFLRLLSLSNKMLGYKNPFIIYKNEIIS